MGRERWLLSSAAAAPGGQQPQRGRGAHAKHSNRFDTLADYSDSSDDSVTSGPGHASLHRRPRPSGTTPGDTTVSAAARGAPLSAPAHARKGDSTQPSAVRFSLIPSQLVGPGGAAAAQPPLPPPPPAPRGDGDGAAAQRTLMEAVAPDAGTHRASDNTRTESRATSSDLARSERGRRHSSGAAPKRDRSTSRSASRPARPPVEAFRKAPGSSSRAATALRASSSDSRRPRIPPRGPETRPPPMGGKPGWIGLIRRSDGSGKLPRRGEFEGFVKEKLKSKATGSGRVSMSSASPFASSADAVSPYPGASHGGARMRASSSWAVGSRGVRQDFCMPDPNFVNPLTSSRLDDSSHDISLLYEVSSGAPNPLTKDNKDTSRASERKRHHHFSAALLKSYSTAAPTYAALAAAGSGPFGADHDNGMDMPQGSAGRSGLPAPQALLFHQLSNESIVAVTMRFRTLSEANRVHATFMNSMPPGFNFANVNESAPHHHSLSRKPVSNTDGTCFTLIDTIGLPAKGSDPACDAFSNKMLGLSAFAGSWTATSDSAFIEITVSAITLVEKHLIPTFGVDNVDFSKETIFVDVGGTKIELVVLDSASKHACARCGSNCHRVKNCGRKVRDMELKAKEKAERELRSAATAERERMSKLTSLDDESAALINKIIKTTGVSNTAILNVMRSKMEPLIRVTDVLAATDGIVDASGLKREVAEIFGKSLTAIASQRDLLRGVAASPASAPSASCHAASAAPLSLVAAASDVSATSASGVSSVPRAMEGVDEAFTSGDSAAASLADAAVSKRLLDNTAASFEESPAKRRPCADALALADSASALAPAPLDRAPYDSARPPGLTHPGTPFISGGTAAASSAATSSAPARYFGASGGASILMTALDGVLGAAHESEDAYRAAAMKAVVSDICSVTNAVTGGNANNLPQYFNSNPMSAPRFATNFEQPSRSTLDGSDSTHLWNPSIAAISSAIGPTLPDPSVHHYGLFIPRLRDVYGAERPARFSLSRLSGALLGVVARALPGLHRSPAWSDAFIYAMPYPAFSGPHSPGTRTTSLPPDSGAEGGAR